MFKFINHLCFIFRVCIHRTKATTNLFLNVCREQQLVRARCSTTRGRRRPPPWLAARPAQRRKVLPLTSGLDPGSSRGSLRPRERRKERDSRAKKNKRLFSVCWMFRTFVNVYANILSWINKWNIQWNFNYFYLPPWSLKTFQIINKVNTISTINTKYMMLCEVVWLN